VKPLISARSDFKRATYRESKTIFAIFGLCPSSIWCTLGAIIYEKIWLFFAPENGRGKFTKSLISPTMLVHYGLVIKAQNDWRDIWRPQVAMLCKCVFLVLDLGPDFQKILGKT